jgi:hypothetical protein
VTVIVLPEPSAPVDTTAMAVHTVVLDAYEETSAARDF